MFIMFREENVDRLKDRRRHGQIRKGDCTFTDTNSDARVI